MSPFDTDDLRARWASVVKPGAVADDAQILADEFVLPGAPLIKAAGDLSAVRRAAVLIPVIDDGTQTSILLTRRATGLPHHAGQIAFPGGMIQQGDAGPLHAALREAHEEIGLSPDHVDVLGMLHAHVTGTGFHIAPLLGVVQPGYSLKLDAREVADAFAVPLEFLMSADNYTVEEIHWQGAARKFYSIRYRDHYIWGATAAILRQVYERFYCE